MALRLVADTNRLAASQPSTGVSPHALHELRLLHGTALSRRLTPLVEARPRFAVTDVAESAIGTCVTAFPNRVSAVSIG